jgi:hypothetical protein
MFRLSAISVGVRLLRQLTLFSSCAVSQRLWQAVRQHFNMPPPSLDSSLSNTWLTQHTNMPDVKRHFWDNLCRYLLGDMEGTIVYLQGRGGHYGYSE